MLKVAGIDPSPKNQALCWIEDGEIKGIPDFMTRGADWIDVFSQFDAVVLEWAMTLPPRFKADKDGKPRLMARSPKSTDDTIGQCHVLANRISEVCPRVYIPTRSRILADLGLKPGTKGNRDQWVSNQLALLGYGDIKLDPKVRWRKTLLSTTHMRSALAAALFDVDDPRNQRYRYEG